MSPIIMNPQTEQHLQGHTRRKHFSKRHGPDAPHLAVRGGCATSWQGYKL